jgi:phosphoadenosine phosphosulfate reductase
MMLRTDLEAPSESMSAQELVQWTQDRFGSKAAFACSFGAEDMVLLDMIARARRPNGEGIRIFTLDTGRLFPETYDLLEKARQRYGIPIHVVFPDAAEVEKMVNEKGPNLFYESVENRKLCCRVRKVLPLDRALSGSEAWVVGLRREQSTERSVIPKVTEDPGHPGVYKVSPLADWSWDTVMEYVRKNDVPISDLHARGYISIGCAPCTRVVPPGADPRSGRWWWETGAKECGLHPEAPALRSRAMRIPELPHLGTIA